VRFASLGHTLSVTRQRLVWVADGGEDGNEQGNEAPVNLRRMPYTEYKA